MSYYRALAIDYDGTLTEGRRPEQPMLEALRAARSNGLKVVLVTGRILSNLREDFPDLYEHFDATVAENGAVLSRGDRRERGLAEPVSPELARALELKGIPVQRGRVLLALSAEHASAAELEIERLGFEYRAMARAVPTPPPAGTSRFRA